eukprot:CAMPEP_0183382804 /NCGR_PEP_ID=MMETSP0164_2-20130417/127130_1 /TAXON_ID=221442 /ORGANISM="Coccolithus pelagicus ssp braarudi, Strain PLY182g" /LENGTH=113 /DNA_ID=CAMNT_0025560429 /DNA_START=859 /DNA_END=1200 /DNA_ORIENTATION=+
MGGRRSLSDAASEKTASVGGTPMSVDEHVAPNEPCCSVSGCLEATRSIERRKHGTRVERCSPRMYTSAYTVVCPAAHAKPMTGGTSPYRLAAAAAISVEHGSQKAMGPISAAR